MAEAKQIQALEQERIPRLLFNYAVPAVVGTVVNSLYNIVDRIFIGQGVSEYALSGLAITFPILLFLQAFGMLVGAGASVRVSILLGQRNTPRAEQTLANAVYLTLVTQILTIIPCYIYMEPLLRLFGASDRTLPYAVEYLRIVIPANFFAAFSFGYNAIMRASGYPRKAMTTMLLSALINVVLDYIFIYPLGMGIRGAAIATAIAMVICAVYVLAHFFLPGSVVRFRRAAFRPSWAIVRAITAIGIAPFAMQLTGSAVNVLMNRSFVAYGTTPEESDLAIGAFGIISSYAMLIVMLILGVAQGMQPIVGFNYGARHMHRVRMAYAYSAGTNLFFSFVGFAVAMLYPRAIVSLFTTSEPLIALCTTALRIGIIGVSLIGFQITTTQLFQSIGFSRLAIFLSLTRQLIFLAPALLILPRFLGLDGVWWSLPVSDMAAVGVAVVLIISRWKLLEGTEAKTADASPEE
ncbi:multidrug transporter MatE [Tannerella sp. oral taxon BU063 isolate Cell 2]|uniref:Multidrug export protein MepA n=1 Tax=Tannerella sp. oral taxon BU063 isolate Cell 2 TaxID=1411148 RepID=W2C678_9BACT|nr:multidrug transporter MatE [Tannerella sp. oral taxon BU063 isolate Cell 2]